MKSFRCKLAKGEVKKKKKKSKVRFKLNSLSPLGLPPGSVLAPSGYKGLRKAVLHYQE